MDDMFNPELLEHLDEFDDEFDDAGDSFPIESHHEIDKSQSKYHMPIAIIGIIILMVIIVIVSALIFNV